MFPHLAPAPRHSWMVKCMLFALRLCTCDARATELTHGSYPICLIVRRSRRALITANASLRLIRGHSPQTASPLVSARDLASLLLGELAIAWATDLVREQHPSGGARADGRIWLGTTVNTSDRGECNACSLRSSWRAKTVWQVMQWREITSSKVLPNPRRCGRRPAPCRSPQ